MQDSGMQMGFVARGLRSGELASAGGVTIVSFCRFTPLGSVMALWLPGLAGPNYFPQNSISNALPDGGLQVLGSHPSERWRPEGASQQPFSGFHSPSPSYGTHIQVLLQRDFVPVMKAPP